MNLKNWRENIGKVTRINSSKLVVIPSIMANEMGLEEGNYVHFKYDEETKSLTITKEER